MHWSRVSGDIFYEQKAPNPADVLAKVAQASDVGEALAAYEPHAAGYVALKAKLAELRAGKEVSGQAAIANGPVLKIGMQDDRVPLLRERLHVSGDGTTYDKALAAAVAKYQKEHEQKATGMLTPATVEALNGRKPDRPIDTIIANLERWRWMPRDLGNTYVMVNLPDFTLRVVHNGHQLWMTKIVDGKPNLPTPIMSAEMKYITVNPTWNVPPSIVAKEYMPVLQQDSTALERMGLKVSTNPDGTVHIAQPPGERNALGRLRFNFPNKFLVYQHDTPEKQLFAYDKRAFSHGCMRVQDPVKYAEVLLSIVRPHDGYTQERIRSMFGNNEQDIQFPTLIPVHLTYQTAFVDDDGKLQFREDVYGRDKALLAILKGDERKVADIPIERKENVVRRELLAMPEQTSFFGGRGGFNGGGRLLLAAVWRPSPPNLNPARADARLSLNNNLLARLPFKRTRASYRRYLRLRRADLRAAGVAFLRDFAAVRRVVALLLSFFFAALTRGAARFDFTFAAGFALRPVFADRFAARLGGALGVLCCAGFSRGSAGRSFLKSGKVRYHRLEIIRLPAAFLVTALVIRHITVLKRQQSAVPDRRKHNRDHRVFVLIGELGCAPRLHDALGGNQFKISAADITVPRRYLRTDLTGHVRIAAGHLGVSETVKPCLVDLLGRSWDRGSQCECIGHCYLLGREGANDGKSSSARASTTILDVCIL